MDCCNQSVLNAGIFFKAKNKKFDKLFKLAKLPAAAAAAAAAANYCCCHLDSTI